MGKENIGRYKRTPAMKRKAAKASKRYWANRKRSEAQKKLVEDRKAAGIKVHTNGRPYSNMSREDYAKKKYIENLVAKLEGLSVVNAMRKMERLREKTLTKVLEASPRLTEIAMEMVGYRPNQSQHDSHRKYVRQLKYGDQEGASALTTLARMQQEAAEGKDTRFRTEAAKDPVALNQLIGVRDLMQTVLKVVDQSIKELAKR